MEIDPGQAQAHAWLSWVYVVRFFQDHALPTIDEAVACGRTAVSLGPNDSQCHAHLAFGYLFRQDFERADLETRRALGINPADGQAVNARAQVLARSGHPEEALLQLDEALRRDPFPPNWHWGNRVTALFNLRRYEEAIAATNRKTRTFWWDTCIRAACCALLGNEAGARAEVAALLAEEPAATIGFIMEVEPCRHARDAGHLAEGLRRAGVPG